MSKRPNFSLDDFKKWMEGQDAESNEVSAEQGMIGSEVQSKINLKKLLSKINVEDGNEEELSQEFSEHGGTVVDCVNKNFLIEVKSGNFYLNSRYVELKD